MRQKASYIIILSMLSAIAYSQRFGAKVGMEYFFNNTEYGQSSYANPQTINGIWFKPQGNIAWDDAHSLHGGLYLLKIPGTKQAVDKVNVSLYYQFDTPTVLFRAGAFPRREALPNYSDFFFTDSISHFIPLMQGLFWQIGRKNNFVNLWMDWTGYATPQERENFFLGSSARLSKGLFFVDMQSYLFHFAGTHPGNPLYGVSEQFLMMASTGISVQSANSFKGRFSVGTLLGFERDRRAEQQYAPVGFVARADAEYWGIGIENTFYTGARRMRFYETKKGDLYWGNPFLQGHSYLQSKWYIRLITSDWANVRFNSNLHLSENHLMFQQTLMVSASVDFFNKHHEKRTRYPWMKIFN